MQGVATGGQRLRVSSRTPSQLRELLRRQPQHLDRYLGCVDRDAAGVALDNRVLAVEEDRRSPQLIPVVGSLARHDVLDHGAGRISATPEPLPHELTSDGTPMVLRLLLKLAEPFGTVSPVGGRLRLQLARGPCGFPVASDRQGR